MTSTSSLFPIQSRMRDKETDPLGVPGGPDTSRMYPRGSPSPNSLSNGAQHRSVSVEDCIIDAADWVAGNRLVAVRMA